MSRKHMVVEVTDLVWMTALLILVFAPLFAIASSI